MFVEWQFEYIVKVIKADNGGEFKPIKTYARDHGIQVRYFCP